MRKEICSHIVVIFLSLLTGVSSAATNGIVFLHGRQSEQPSIEKVSKYWEDLVRASTQDYQLPTLLVRYDGSQHMKVAAQQASKQINDFIQQHQLTDNSITLVGHSYGGIIARYLLSNPEQKGDYESIISTTKQVITMGAPHKGSEAADTALDWHENGAEWQRWLADWLGSVNDSLKLLTTNGMQYVNQQCILLGTAGCPPLPKPFLQISGGYNANFWLTYFQIDDHENFGLAMTSEMIPFPGVHDGLVASYSSEGLVGNASVLYKTERNHHHLRNDRHNPTNEDSLSHVLFKVFKN